MQIISRQAAAKLGMSQYFTGKACRHGHLAYRYVQSGTCSACIATATAKSRADLAASRAPRPSPTQKRALLAELVEFKVRAHPHDAVQLAEMAAALSLAAFPALSRDDVTVRAASTAPAGGTALYRLLAPLQYVQLLKDTAAALLNAHSPDLGAFHKRQVRQAADLAPSGNIPAHDPR